MSTRTKSAFLKRAVPIGVVAAAACVATTTFAFGAGSGAKHAATSRAAGHNTAPVVNVSPNSTASYWTEARRKAAKPLDRARSGATGQSAGTANLDFARSRITPQTANKAAPYNGVGKLYFTEPGVGGFQCSASIIGNRLVVTAGHCVFGSGHYYTDWQFIPGFDGSQNTVAKQEPYGAWNWCAALAPGNYQATSSTVVNDYDFAIIQFCDQSFNGGAPQTLYKKVKTKFNTAVGHLFDTHATILGYPCNFDSCNIMQRVDSSDHRPSGVASGTNGDTAYEYGSDMTGGSSGGPWVENFGNPGSAAPQGVFAGRNTVVAVTSYGYTDTSVLIQGASQFNADFTSIKNTMCNFQAGNC
ncbi:MAG: trypsin-like serine peptidase [Actinomycetes bacterium]